MTFGKGAVQSLSKKQKLNAVAIKEAKAQHKEHYRS